MTLQPILTVDLTTGELGQFDVPADWQQDYLGGASLAARMLYDELTPDLDPLSSNGPATFHQRPAFRNSRASGGPFCDLWEITRYRSVGRIKLWRFLGAGITQGWL